MSRKSAYQGTRNCQRCWVHRAGMYPSGRATKGSTEDQAVQFLSGVSTSVEAHDFFPMKEAVVTRRKAFTP